METFDIVTDSSPPERVRMGYDSRAAAERAAASLADRYSVPLIVVPNVR